MKRLRIGLVLVFVVAALTTACMGTTPATQTPKSSGATAQASPAQPAITGGRDLFMAYCAKCHGAGGVGDGPSAGSLRVQPANLTLVKDRSDTDIFTTISSGRGSDMPPFELILTREQRQELVKFVRTLGRK